MIGFHSTSRFQPQALRQRARKGNFEALGHAAAAIRLSARRSIRRRKSASSPGTPPSTRQGQLRRGIRYHVDRQRQQAVIGPTASSVGRSATAHEYGGRYRGQIFIKRPFMNPALEANRNRLPKHWQGSVR